MARKSLEKRNRENTVPVDTTGPHTVASQNEEHSTDAHVGGGIEDTVPSLTPTQRVRLQPFPNKEPTESAQIMLPAKYQKYTILFNSTPYFRSSGDLRRGSAARIGSFFLTTFPISHNN